jgi:hypothetical protein
VKISFLKFAFGLFSIGFIWSCNSNDLQPDSGSIPNNSYEKIEENRETFAKTFAVALSDVSVRELIKKEADKQFDGEEEVLFQVVKDQKLSNGQSLIDKLISIHGSEDRFRSIVKSLPLLTILVPEVYQFSNDKWDVASQVPAVAALKTKNGKTIISELNTFYLDGTVKELKRNVVPNEPVLVVKDSERIILSDDVNKRVGQDLGKAFQAGNFAFRYLDKRYETTNPSKPGTTNARQFGSWWEVNPYVWNAAYYHMQFHRDYVYYGITPELGVTTGPFKTNVREYITSIRFENVNNLQNAFDDTVTDWSDGHFEFQITALFVDNKTAPSSVMKVFDASLGDMCDYTVNQNGSITINSLKTFRLFNPQGYGAGPGKAVEIAPWDMKRYGDTWKFVVQEQDATTNTTYSYTTGITSSFGTNYTSNYKDGPNFGSTTSFGTSYSQTFTLAVSGQSDVLGEALLHWTDKVIDSGTWVYDETDDDYRLEGGGTREISTGTIAISVEPLSF